MEAPFPSPSLSVALEERHLLHYFFFPQTIHVGGLENKTEMWEDPCERTGSFMSYTAAELDIRSIKKQINTIILKMSRSMEGNDSVYTCFSPPPPPLSSPHGAYCQDKIAAGAGWTRTPFCLQVPILGSIGWHQSHGTAGGLCGVSE